MKAAEHCEVKNGDFHEVSPRVEVNQYSRASCHSSRSFMWKTLATGNCQKLEILRNFWKSSEQKVFSCECVLHFS